MKKEPVPEAEFLNAVLENAGALVVVLDREGRIRRFNQACEKLSGYTFAEIEGKYPWKTFLPPEDSETIRKQAFEALVNNPHAPAGNYTNYWVNKNGQRFLTEWSNTLLLDASGKMEFMVCLGTDVTERKRLEQEKHDTECWFQGIFNSIEEAILVVSPDRLLATINPAAEEMFGYSADEVKNQSTEIFHVNRERYMEFGARLYEAFSKNETAEFEFQAKRKNGEIFPTEHCVSHLRNDAGEALGIVSIVRDITERKRVKDALRVNNQIMAAVLDTTSVMIAYLDADMNFVRVNRAYAMAEGKNPEYFVGKNHFALYPDPENEATFRRVVETGEPYTAKARPFEYEHSPDRGVTHRDWTLTPIKDAGGKVTGLVLSLLDVTDRIEAMEAVQCSERELKALNESLETRVQERTAEVKLQAQRNQVILNTALDGFFSVDMNGRIRAVNPAMCAMLGYSEEELLQMSVPDIEGLETSADVSAHIEKIIANGHDRFDTRHRRKDGSPIDVEMSVSFVDGDENMLYGFAHDITPRKDSEAALIRAREEAERANQAKSEFLSRMSHELRTPMNAILGFGQLLELENLTPNQRESVSEILHAGRHLLDLINEVLDLSRIEAGRVDLSIESVEVTPLINECLTMVMPLAARRQITVTATRNACPRYAVMADHVRLRQIIINLLSNAIKYNREAGHVSVDCKKNPDGGIRLSVRDTGKGIPSDSIPRLFRPFERLESPYSGIEGTGIGLVLAKRLTEAMGGKIGVDSQDGVGSVFWIDLPAAESATVQK